MSRTQSGGMDWRGSDTTKATEEFARLVESPPATPIKITIGPEMARWLLATVNLINRPMRPRNLAELSRAIKAGKFIVTADTIKVSGAGRLIDGQHRLQACHEVGVPITTFVAFGVDEASVDVVDTGARRTPADVLSINGIAQATRIAGAVRVARMIEEASPRAELTNAEVLDLVTGRMGRISDWAPLAGRMQRGKGIPDSLTMGLAFKIAETNEAMASAFFEAWMHGLREGRNAGFTVLETRIASAKRDGVLTRTHTLAFMILTFNAWAEERAVSKSALHWNSRAVLPTLWSSKRVAEDDRAEHWTAADLGALARLRKAGASWNDIARELRRSATACRNRFKAMRAEAKTVEIESEAPARHWPI